jgi:hypothetical protein
MTISNKKIRIIREKVERVIESACYKQKDTVKAYITLANKMLSKYNIYEKAEGVYDKRIIDSLFNSKFNKF